MGIELLTCMDIIWILVRFCWITLFGQTNHSQTIRYMINCPFFTWPPWQLLRFAPHSTSPHFVPTGHASVCDACLWSSSCMQVVAGPMGVCWGMALREGRLPHQHHHTNTDNSAEGSAAFRPTLHLPQCQPHRTCIRLQCVSTVIIWYAGSVWPNGCLWGVGVFECGGYLLLQHHANIDADGCPSVFGRHVA